MGKRLKGIEFKNSHYGKRNIKAWTRRQIDIQYDYEDIKEEKYDKCNIY